MTMRDVFMAELAAANERRWAKILRDVDTILWGAANAAIPPHGVPSVLFPPPVPDEAMPLIVEVPAAQSPPVSDSTPA